MNSSKIYRPNVAAIILSPSYPSACEIFIGERSDIAGAWQFPQGGIDEGETPKEALYRELEEEIGTNQVEIIAQYPESKNADSANAGGLASKTGADSASLAKADSAKIDSASLDSSQNSSAKSASLDSASLDSVLHSAKADSAPESSWIYYDYPPHIAESKAPFCGQKQKYFLVKLKEGAQIDLNTPEPEFARYEFVAIDKALQKISGFKAGVYREVLAYFQKKGYLSC